MFIKITKNKKGQAYYHLVESYRNQGKVKQRTLLSLGKVGEDGLDKLVAAIGKHKDVLTAVEAAKSVEIEDTIKKNDASMGICGSLCLPII
jgi:hypothetical protein